MRTKSAIEKQIEAIESKLLTLGGGDTSAWFARLLKDGDANEAVISAGFLMLRYGILDAPAEAIKQRLHFRFDPERVREFPDCRLIFIVACTESGNEIFDDPESHPDLCRVALTLYQVFQGAPLPVDPRERAFRQEKLESYLIKPPLERVCPGMMANHSVTGFRAWLEHAKDLPLNECVESLRAFSGSPAVEAHHD